MTADVAVVAARGAAIVDLVARERTAIAADPATVDHVVAGEIAAVAVGAALVAVGAAVAFAEVAGGAAPTALVAAGGRQRGGQPQPGEGRKIPSVHHRRIVVNSGTKFDPCYAHAMSATNESSPAEAELLAAARRGDRAALTELLARHQQRVFGFGVKMCGNPDDARDVAQDTLLTMARKVRDFRGDASLSTWLYTVARSFCIKKRRRTKGAPAYHEPLDRMTQERAGEPSSTPEQMLLGREARDTVTAALDALEPDAREVVILRDIEGLTAAEVAEVTGVSVAAVKSRLHRARAALREHLLAALGGEPAAPHAPSCPDVLTLLSRKLEDEISPEVCAEMEAHVAGCPHCAGLCDSLKRTLATCRSFPTPEVPAHVQASLRRAIADALAETG